MSNEPDLASIAGLIGDPTRAAILSALMGGVALPASELAARAQVTPQTASAHLAKLLDGNLIQVTRNGRHRYYALKGQHIAQMLETLQALAPPQQSIALAKTQASPELKHARTCYDHLAGELGVAVTEAWVQRGYLLQTDDHYTLTDSGSDLLTAWGIDVVALRKKRRKFAYCCLDWSERRYHLAGAVGAAVAQHFLDVDWVRRRQDSRALLVTGTGAVALWEQFRISLVPLPEPD